MDVKQRFSKSIKSSVGSGSFVVVFLVGNIFSAGWVYPKV